MYLIVSDEELLSDCYDLIRAGSVSTADAIALVMLYLVLHPDVQSKMCKEIDANIGREVSPTLEDKKRYSLIFFAWDLVLFMFV